MSEYQETTGIFLRLKTDLLQRVDTQVSRFGISRVGLIKMAITKEIEEMERSNPNKFKINKITDDED